MKNQDMRNKVEFIAWIEIEVISLPLRADYRSNKRQIRY
jgi:hypothetical protein